MGDKDRISAYSRRSLPIGKLLLGQPWVLVFYMLLGGSHPMWFFLAIAALKITWAGIIRDSYWWSPGDKRWPAWVGRTVLVVLAGLWVLAGRYIGK